MWRSSRNDQIKTETLEMPCLPAEAVPRNRFYLLVRRGLKTEQSLRCQGLSDATKLSLLSFCPLCHLDQVGLFPEACPLLSTIDWGSQAPHLYSLHADTWKREQIFSSSPFSSGKEDFPREPPSRLPYGCLWQQ